ncbi:GNAT family N-acetyltransferase [Streptomyces sp. NPDC057900]|uniref:GNAT family N-acetyltransferase n=1 Tax=Streptomyces sp. NPDC057900 TaxID=3346274 RepID=UPI0036EC62EA
MPPADAYADPGAGTAPRAGTGAEDPPDPPGTHERLAPPAEDIPGVPCVPGPPGAPGTPRMPAGPGAPGAAVAGNAAGVSELFDRPAAWPPATTPAGVFQLVPVRLERDLAVISRWMNDPAVAAFWELSGTETVTADHLRSQLDGDGSSLPCLGVLSGIPMSYWEIYRADLDPLARHYPARAHDTGIHLLIGENNNRGRGVGAMLLRATSDLVLDNRPLCTRVVAEPDVRNTPSVSAFLSAGFRFSAEIGLPDKRAALMIRDRDHRAQL